MRILKTKFSIKQLIFKKKRSAAFTLIELLVVVAIIGILSGLSFPFYSRLVLQNTTADTTNNLVGSLRKAQIYALSGKDGSDWAVSYSSSQIKLIRQSTGTAFDTYNVSSNIGISSLNQIIFSHPSGLPNTTGTFSVSNGIEIESVVLNSEGVVSVLH